MRYNYTETSSYFLWNLNSHNWCRVNNYIHRSSSIPINIFELAGDCGYRLVLRESEYAVEYRGCAGPGAINYVGNRFLTNLGFHNILLEGMLPKCPECLSRISETEYLIYLKTGGAPWTNSDSR